MGLRDSSLYSDFNISVPFFELGPKAYLYGEHVLELALCADQISAEYDVTIIMTPQYVDIPLLARQTKDLLIFAQHIGFA